MPDPNKLQALRESGFKVRPNCSYCRFFRIGNRPSWGTCEKIPYEHQKHSGPARHASVPATGVCPAVKVIQEAVESHLGSHAEFFEEYGDGASE